MAANDDWPARLRNLRQQRGLSQEDLAHRIGAAFSTVNRWERGRSQPSPRMATRLGQLDAGDPRPAVAVVVTRGLPVGSDEFVGRAAEVEKLLSLWGQCRLLTLTGAAGIGKTELAIAVLGREAAAGVHIVSFGEAIAAADVFAGIEGAVRAGVADRPGTAAVGSGRDGVVVLLDTCERVAPAVAEAVAVTLSARSDVRFMATSQVGLGLPEERVWRVGPLEAQTLPSSGAVSSEPGGRRSPARSAHPAPGVGQEADDVRLFLAHLHQHRPALVPSVDVIADVAEVCRRVDGVPLAIALAADWMASLTPAQLLQRWDERRELLTAPDRQVVRHRSLDAAAQWNAKLLSPQDRQLVGRLSLFAGPFALDDVDAVTARADDAALARSVRRLVDLAWLEFRDGDVSHYLMLEHLRAWGRDQLGSSGDAERARQQLAEHLALLCARAEADRFAGKLGEWRKRLDLLAATIIDVLKWARHHDHLMLLHMTVSLLGWWRSSGRLVEGRRWLSLASAAELSGGRQPASDGSQRSHRADDESTVWRARSRCAEALLAMDMGDYDAAHELATAALPDLGAAGDDVWSARALTACSSAAKYRGDAATARDHLEAAVGRLQQPRDAAELAVAYNNLGALTAENGDLGAAQEFYAQSLRLKRRLDDLRGVALTMANLADVWVQTGDTVVALDYLDEAYEIVEQLNDPFLLAFIRINRGDAHLHAGDPAAAITEYTAAHQASRAFGIPRFQALAACGVGEALLALGRTPEALRHLRESRDVAEDIGDEIVLAQVRRAMTDAVGGSQEVRTPKDLSLREIQVLEHLIGGLANQEIATRLGITSATVKKHLVNTYTKLGVSNRTAAAAAARELGLRHRS